MTTTTNSLYKRDGWHLDKKVPISLIMVVIVQFTSGIWLLADMRKDIDILKLHQGDQRDRETVVDRQRIEYTAMVNQRLEKIDNKLDRLIERLAK